MHGTHTTITRHGKQRLKGRAGIKRSAHPAVAKRAFEQGLSMDDTAGRLHEWTAHQYSTRSKAREMRLYDFRLFIFGEDAALITVIDLPGDLRNHFEMAMQKKKKKAARDAEPREQTNDEREGITMGELTIINHEGTLVADSREVAAWVGKRHDHLMRDIQGYCEILSTQQNPNLGTAQFFIESNYHAEDGSRTYPCYLITKKGCDMVANKLTGEKGVRFTATYIDRFYEMEAALNHPGPRIMSPAELSLLQAQALVAIERKQNEQQAALESVNQRLDNIGDILTLTPNAWREESKKMVVRIAQKLGGNQFITDVYSEIYRVMLERFSFNVKVRRTNKKRKALEEGMPKSRVENISCIDAIADDKKAIESFLTIIKEMAIVHGVDKVA